MNWTVAYLEWNTLGLWHATNHLKAISTIKDPWEQAHDVVQTAWETLWKRRDHTSITKGLFITIIHGLAANVIRDARPIEIHYKRRNGARTRRMTSTYPVQIFATLLDEIETPGCGDE